MNLILRFLYSLIMMSAFVAHAQPEPATPDQTIVSYWSEEEAICLDIAYNAEASATWNERKKQFEDADCIGITGKTFESAELEYPYFTPSEQFAFGQILARALSYEKLSCLNFAYATQDENRKTRVEHYLSNNCQEKTQVTFAQAEQAYALFSPKERVEFNRQLERSFELARQRSLNKSQDEGSTAEGIDIQLRLREENTDRLGSQNSH